jgi:glucose-6-phosphate 1-epimerase
MDRAYLSTPTKIAVIDHEKKRTLVLRKEGFPDAGIIGYEILIVQNL